MKRMGFAILGLLLSTAALVAGEAGKDAEQMALGQPFRGGKVTRLSCVGFLENYNGDKPFFLNAGFLNPHDCCFTAGAGGVQGKFRFAKEIEDNDMQKRFLAFKNKLGLLLLWQ